MAWPKELTADFTYLRFHGSGQCYGGNYPDAHLRNWAKRLEAWRPQLRSAYIYFNNDIGGHAIRNARTLRKMLNRECLDGAQLAA
jgi:uncharacterized protein YecE (DUF72 family)